MEVGCRRARRESPFDDPIDGDLSRVLPPGARPEDLAPAARAAAAAAGCRLTELPESSWCCGSAGIYALTQPEQAEALLKRKVGHIGTTGAQIVATANPGCHLQIARGLKAAGRRSR